MAEKPTTRHRGSGRAAFIARLSTIRAEIAAGDYLVTVHDRHKAALGITYSAFRKLVQRYADDAKPRRISAPRSVARSSEGPLLASLPAETKAQPAPHGQNTVSHEGQPIARHEPAPRPRTFVYDGNPKPDDKARLIGRREPKS